MADEPLSPERAYRLLLGIAGDLETQIESTHGNFAPDPVTVAAHLAVVARLLADEIGRRLDAGAYGH